MSDFETVYKKHGENFIWNILEIWERNNSLRFGTVMTLEERWKRFISATNDNLSQMNAAVAACH